MSPLPTRHPNRLQSYSYSSAGAYFITICAAEKQKIFGEIVGGGVPDAPPGSVDGTPKLQLSGIGKNVERQLLQMDAYYPELTVEKYTIMPNHIHFILRLYDGHTGSSGTPTPTKANERVPKFVSELKRFTNKISGQTLWQRSYYDHVIRDEKDYQKIWNYIETNPLRWTLDCFYDENTT